MYEINIDNVIGMFDDISGVSGDSGSCLTFIQMAIFKLNSCLKKSPSNLSEEKSVEYACACTAFYNYTLLFGSVEKNSETPIGTITVENNSTSRIAHAKQLMDNAILLISDLLNDSDFVFISVRG